MYYLVTDDKMLIIELFSLSTNRLVATYYYESNFDYLMGQDILLAILDC